ncbi:transcriptional regulator, LacI family [Streptoalloteichus tenebrarius]|uniref:Transcriptional regulator, LacI family n=1 Tax=Streptoalloteichus tenebrarius (strain ATCC 17920 / DSM 40477 / JCM 4838 / CBS 697.72 / NBRC 16177 / NCIMB 11028 / NRRL B-12390 / A12253. 1 / ISP 5477) TaxID=1933 RepID=A0ABT1HZQ7_STRSD|nr:LacI family DNA-binding transcriptional regulator [Streptoalloteichus tenebrarius]MCP2261017.1 transcriptional regulator, LacI family [Streptoalloteichus tenebrarius]BFF03191.1 LacI family DNA-binding transcriptional regulator [Streptoalloteichus tenebrarius]
MSDVARLAGVSIKTVSRVVNDEPGVHPGTAERVLAAIEQLGFRRNVGARNLRRGSSTGTVGLILEDVANPFYSLLTRAVEEVARQHGRLVLTGSSDEEPARERDLALEFCARRVDGLLIVPAGLQHGYLVPEMRAGTPVVFLDRPAGDVVADTVLVDNIGGTAEAVRHLASFGHRRVAFLGDSPGIYTAVERLRGFREGCARAGLRYDDDLVVMGPPDERGVAAALRRLLSGPDPATAVVAGNNRITVHAVRALAHRPDRPALVGFDDFELADLLDPPVTVVAHDTAALGRVAAELLFGRLDGDSSPPRRVVLPVRLVARGSGEVRLS